MHLSHLRALLQPHPGFAMRPTSSGLYCSCTRAPPCVYSTPRLHGFVRECVVQQLRRCPEAFKDYVLDSSCEC